MDEIVFNRIRFTVSDLSLWESFLSDVLDLNVTPRSEGLELKLPSFVLELVAGAATPLELEFNLSFSEREVIKSRWSFYQYRGNVGIVLDESDSTFVFQIDGSSSLVVRFKEINRCEKLTDQDSVVRNF